MHCSFGTLWGAIPQLAWGQKCSHGICEVSSCHLGSKEAKSATHSNWPHTAILLSESFEVSPKKEGSDSLWCLALEDDIDKGGECRQQRWAPY